MAKNLSVAERLAKLSAPQANGCILFTGHRITRGYGLLDVRDESGSRKVYAHRIAYVLSHGPIPEGAFVCHRCDVPACINPEHLFVGTHRDNMVDMVRKGRASGNYAVHPAPVGEKSHNAKLTEAQVRELKSRYTGRRGELPRLARELGIGLANARLIVRGERWQHVKVVANG